MENLLCLSVPILKNITVLNVCIRFLKNGQTQEMMNSQRLIVSYTIQIIMRNVYAMVLYSSSSGS